MNPGDTLEGHGLLLQHGRLVAEVDYHLTIPSETHFFVNPTGRFRLDYEEHLGGFIVIRPADEEKISLREYTLELANKHKRLIRVERRYKRIKRNGKARISYWVRVIQERMS